MAKNRTAEERAARLAEYHEMIAQGMMLKEIAARWGCSLSALREWRGLNGLAPPLKKTLMRAVRQPRPDIEAAKAAPRMERHCLTCGNQFSSERASGAWLRLCDHCRRTSFSPYTPGGAGTTGRRVTVGKA